MKKKDVLAATIAILIIFSSFSVFNPGAAIYQAQPKPMEFYFHNVTTPVNVGGIQTTHIMNTKKEFSYQTLDQAFANSFDKPIGQPKIDVDFYLYPNFAGPVTVDGNWEVSLWVNASAYKPTGFNLEFQEISASGQTLWDSGQLSPDVTSSINSYTDVPVLNYKLSVPLTHTFTAGSTLLVIAEVNAGSTAETRIWYDSPTYQSKITLPAKDYARAVTIKTYNVDGAETSNFASNVSDANRVVKIDANVTDPFGGYDVYQVNITITDPEGKAVVANTNMTMLQNTQWQTSYSNIYELKWSYPSTAALGNYSIIITVIDNNGYNVQQQTGSYSPFIEQSQVNFNIGVITYYDPVIRIVDDKYNSLPGAQVYVTWRNGTTDQIPRSTDENGSLQLTNAPEGNYNFTVYYKGSKVQQTSMYINSNGPYTIKTLVYELNVKVLDNNKQPVSNAFVVIYSELGDGEAINITDSSGNTYLKLPDGNYTIEAYYTGDYWLTQAKTNASMQVSLSQSATEQIQLNGYPPAIWTTTGFYLIVAAIVVAIVAAVSIYLKLYHKKSTAVTKN